MILYIHSKCSTCQKAVKFLEKEKLAFITKEIIQEPPTLKDLYAMLEYQNGNWKKLCNTSGQLYREMQLSEKLNPMPLSQILTLLSQHGMLVKRPFLLADQVGLVGFNEAEWLEKLL